MNFKQLEYFVAVAELLSFTKAAKKCFISQTAMTQQIRSLEGKVGVPLFLRDKHHVELTAAGKISLPLSLGREGLLVLRMRGANMSPLILPGAHLGVDTLDTNVVSGQIYTLFAPNEGLMLRRVFLNGTQDGYLLRSESSDFPETSLTPDLLSKRLLGKVVWILQEF